MISGILLSILLVSSLLGDAYAQENDLHPEPLVMEQIAYDGKIKVQLEWPEVYPGEIYPIQVRFLDAETDEPINNIAFGVYVSQDNHTIEDLHVITSHTGTEVFEVMYEKEGPSTITITIFDVEDDVEINEEIIFSVNVVPEFPFTLIVMFVSVAMIIVLTKIHPITRIRSN